MLRVQPLGISQHAELLTASSSLPSSRHFRPRQLSIASMPPLPTLTQNSFQEVERGGTADPLLRHHELEQGQQQNTSAYFGEPGGLPLPPPRRSSLLSQSTYALRPETAALSDRGPAESGQTTARGMLAPSSLQSTLQRPTPPPLQRYVQTATRMRETAGGEGTWSAAGVPPSSWTMQESSIQPVRSGGGGGGGGGVSVTLPRHQLNFTCNSQRGDVGVRSGGFPYQPPMQLEDIEGEPWQHSLSRAPPPEDSQNERKVSLEEGGGGGEGEALQRNLEDLYEKRKAMAGELKVQVELVGSLHRNEVSRLQTVRTQLRHEQEAKVLAAQNELQAALGKLYAAFMTFEQQVGRARSLKDQLLDTCVAREQQHIAQAQEVAAMLSLRIEAEGKARFVAGFQDLRAEA